MALLTPLKNEKSAQAEISAMQYPASQADHTSIIPGHLIHTIIRPALLLILLLFSSFSALAYDCKVDNIYYNLNNDDKTASVTNTTNNKYVGNIIIPESITYSGTTYSVTSIGDNAFRRSLWLTSVTIPNSVTSIGDNAFGGCSGLTSVTVDKNNGTYDSRDNCNAIIDTSTNTLIVGCKNTIIPNSVTSIGNSAFYGCTGLTSVTIPNSVTSIGDRAFSGCSGLTSVTIGNSVTSIGDGAFEYCWRLINLVSLAVEPPTCGIGAFKYVDKTSCKLLVPEESINKYKTADQWKEFLNILGYNGVDDVSVDSQNAVYEVYNLQGVRIGRGMREAEVTADALPHGVYILVSPQGRKKLKI